MITENRRKKNLAMWDRINIIIEEKRLTVNSFGSAIGLLRSERLYQIKSGNYGISMNLAEKINRTFPEYSIAWLLGLTGTEQRIEGTLHIPLYLSVFDVPGTPKAWLDISRHIAPDAKLAMRYMVADKLIPTYLNDAIFLLKEEMPENIRIGKMYYMIAGQFIGLCIVDVDKDDGNNFIVLNSAMSFGDSKLRVCLENIVKAWAVEGVILKDLVENA